MDFKENIRHKATEIEINRTLSQFRPATGEAFRDLREWEIQEAYRARTMYEERTIMDVEKLHGIRQKRRGLMLPKDRATIMGEPIMETEMDRKQKQKRKKELEKKVKEYKSDRLIADVSTVLMEEKIEKFIDERKADSMKWEELEESARTDQYEELDKKMEEMVHTPFHPEDYAGDRLVDYYDRLRLMDYQRYRFLALIDAHPEYLDQKTPEEKARYEHFRVMARKAHSVLALASILKGCPMDEEHLIMNEGERNDALERYANEVKDFIVLCADNKQVVFNLDQAIADRFIDQKMTKNQTEEESFREEMKKKNPWLHTEHISTKYSMDIILAARELLVNHPDKYEEQKPLLDEMLGEIQSLQEVWAYNMKRQSVAAELEGQLDSQREDKYELWRAVSTKGQILDDENTALVRKINAITNAMKYIIEDRVDDVQYTALEYLEEKGYHIPEYEQRKEEQVAAAGFYADTMKDRQELYERLCLERGGTAGTDRVLKGTNARKEVLLRTDTSKGENVMWNQDVINLAVMEAEQGDQITGARYDLAKKIAEKAMEAIFTVDIDRMAHASPEELVAMQEELMNANIPQMAVADIAKIWKPQQAGAAPLRLKEDILGDRMEEYTVRCNLVRYYVDKARGYAIQTAIRNNVATADMMTKTERVVKAKLKPEDTEEEMLEKIKQFIQTDLIEEKSSVPEMFLPKWEHCKEEKVAKYHADEVKKKMEIFRRMGMNRGGIAATDQVLTDVVGRDVMLIRTDESEEAEVWNQKVLQMAVDQAEQKQDEAAYRLKKEILTVIYDKALMLDVFSLKNATSEELIAMQDTLFDVNIAQMMATDLGKRTMYPAALANQAAPGTIVPENLRKDILGDREKLYESKLELIRMYADKARGYAIKRAIANGSTAKSLYTDREQGRLSIRDEAEEERLRSIMGEQAGNLVTHMDPVAQEMWRRTVIAHVDRAERTTNPRIERWNRYLTEENMLTPEGNTSFTEEEKETAIDYREKLISWLSNQDYKLAGEDKKMIREPVFRTFSSMLTYESVKEMSDTDFELMLEQLAAGAFLTEESTEEEIKQAKERNMEGLRTYVEIERRQYDYLEKKFGFGLESLSVQDFITHYEEICTQLQNLQVDHNMITHMPKEILNPETSVEDARLYHQVEYYNAMGASYAMIRAAAHSGGSYREFLDMHKENMVYGREDTMRSREYLRTHTDIRETVNWQQRYGE